MKSVDIMDLKRLKSTPSLVRMQMRLHSLVVNSIVTPQSACISRFPPPITCLKGVKIIIITFSQNADKREDYLARQCMLEYPSESEMAHRIMERILEMNNNE